MNTNHGPDDRILVTRLKEEAEHELPGFSPALHAQIMRKVAARIAGNNSGRKSLHPWIFQPALGWGVAAAAVIIVLGVLFLRTFPLSTQLTESRQPIQTINLSSAFPDPGLLMDQTATQWQRQISAQRYFGLQNQTQLLTRYVVHKIRLF